MADQDQSAEDLFGEALDMPTGERSAYLFKACLHSPKLRAEVESLLADYQRMGAFLADSPVTPTAEPPGKHPASGSMLGRYLLMEPLGAGGMGTVYRALDQKLERTVAVKILSPGVVSGDDARRRFRKEALALARLNHAAIAPIYDVGEQDGIDYLVMECITGQTLAARLREGPLDVKQATAIVLEIAQALEEAHEAGIVHRDLKPANVMLNARRGGNASQVKVLDFGIAKLLAPAAGSGAAAAATLESSVLIGTPLYMSPEQAEGKAVDARSDLWSLGALYFQCLTGQPPFPGQSGIAILHAVIHDPAPAVTNLRPDAPAEAAAIIARALQKDPADRFQSATEMVTACADLMASLTTTLPATLKPARHPWRAVTATAAVVLLLAVAAGAWLYHRAARRQWAREEAMPQISAMLEGKRPLAAFMLLKEATSILPEEPALKTTAAEQTQAVDITSDPAGAYVFYADYLPPDQSAPGQAASAPQWISLGTTPIKDAAVPKGYFRWKITHPGFEDVLLAAQAEPQMTFAFDQQHATPAGMVPVQATTWSNMIDFVGWLGPYKLPPYFIDRFEVTNRDYQKFVDSGGYAKPEYWREPFSEGAATVTREDAMARFRDATGRPGPAGWIAGHYPDGKAQQPVSGVSWYEAAAYAAWAGKQLPVLSQWYNAAPPSAAFYAASVSNMQSANIANVGTFQGIGPYGTYDMAGNVREWVANPVEDQRRLILGGSWRSPTYFYFEPEALSPFDRSEQNGFRCVLNRGPIPAAATTAIQHEQRDFTHFKPAPDNVFKAYQVMYDYQRTPLNVQSGGVVAETADWREEKVTYDAAYRGERMAAYLFLPKKVKPPFETVLFFPSARILFLPTNENGRALGDMKFFDYIIQSGRAVLYPIYEDTYERRLKFSLPRGAQGIELTSDWYKDASRSLDYLNTRPDIDSSRLAYVGVSMGSAEGIIATALFQQRLKTTILLDGGFFQDQPPPGGDQADFASRIHIPVLMVNGRFDYVFALKTAQEPLFRLLGTPEKDKRHLIFETPHDVTEARPQLIRGVTDWLDHYLGPVQPQ